MNMCYFIHLFLQLLSHFFAMRNSVALSIPGIYFKMWMCKNFSCLYAYSLNSWIIVYVHIQLFNLMPNCSVHTDAQFTQSRHSFWSARSPVSPFLKNSQAMTSPQVQGKQACGGCHFIYRGCWSGVCNVPGVVADAEDTTVNGRGHYCATPQTESINICSTCV